MISWRDMLDSFVSSLGFLAFMSIPALGWYGGGHWGLPITLLVAIPYAGVLLVASAYLRARFGLGRRDAKPEPVEISPRRMWRLNLWMAIISTPIAIVSLFLGDDPSDLGRFLHHVALVGVGAVVLLWLSILAQWLLGVPDRPRQA